jgi:diguanylate cyclase (GGDEF)-like protein
LLWLPAGETRTLVFGALNSALVAILALRLAMLHLFGGRRELDGASARLGLVFLVHGLWYCLKTGLVFAHGAYEMARFQGFAIQLSLFEGIMVEVLLALSMAAAVRRRRESEIARDAERDPLTGVFNRRAFQQRAAALLGRTASVTPRGVLMLLDLDRFKAVNDRFGHPSGDRVLLALTEAVTDLLPGNALFARLGGDEFVLLLPDMAEADADALGQAICAGFASGGTVPLPIEEKVTVSVGAATYGGGVPLPELMSNADAALYEAKRHGRDRLCWHGARPHHRALRGALTAA